MTRVTLLLTTLLLLSSFAHAASSAEAINFAENTEHLLYDNETAEIYPVVLVSHSNDDYWVVSVLSAGSIAAFIPVEDASDAEQLQLPKGELARKQLIKTTHYMRLYDQLKTDFSMQGIWPLKNTDVEFFSSLSNELKNEKVDLTTIGSELDGYIALQLMADDLEQQLDGLHLLAGEIAGKMGVFKETEAEFFSGPDTNALDDFVDELDDVFLSIRAFDSKRADYLADLDSLKQGIAQTDLSVDSKRSLNSLASIPQKMIEVSSRITNAINLQEKADEAYITVLNQSGNFVQGLEAREKRGIAWMAIYGFDNEIVEAVQLQGVDSLNALVGLVLSDEYIYRWEEQGTIAKLQENWSKTHAYYNSGAFDSAENFAEESKKNALKIFKAGLAKLQQPIDTDLLFTGVVLLIVVLIILYAFKNRDKLSSLVSASSEEEVPVHEWEK